jgi:hypothetical protein
LIAVALILLALLPVSGQAPGGPGEPSEGSRLDAELETRVFVIRHKDLEDVISLIRPALSEDSSILIQSKLGTISITDYPARVERVASLLAGFDLPPHDVSINVNLIKASRGGPGPRAKMTPGHLPPSILRELTQWLDYELLGGMSILTTEAEDSSLILGDQYRIRFWVDLVDDRAGKIRLKNFVLERRRRAADGAETFVPIFDTVVNLKSGTPYVFGATRGENAQRALFLTVTASIVP